MALPTPVPLSREDEEYDAEWPWIRAWCTLCGFSRAFLHQQLEVAASTHAPSTAVFYDSLFDPRWVTLEQVSDPESRLWLLEWAKIYDLHVPGHVLHIWLGGEPPAASVTAS